MDAAGIPYRIVPGNHDDRSILSRIFGLPLRPSGGLFGVERFGKK